MPRPPHWGGYRLVPDRIEFWSDRPHRLHERRIFTHDGDSWCEGLALPVTTAKIAAEHSAFSTRAALASVTLALILLIAKAWAAYATDSTAMLGSLADTALDVIASIDDARSACGSPRCPPTATIASGTARPRRWSRSLRSR